MKKTIILFLIALVSLIPLASCINTKESYNSVRNNDNPYIPLGFSTWETIDNPDYPRDERLALNPEKEDLPSYFDLKDINEQSTLEEVYSIAGLPQRNGMGPTIPFGAPTPLKSYIYDTREGISYEVIYGVKEDMSEQWEFGVYDFRVIYPDNAEYIVLAVIISAVAIVAVIVAAAVVRRKKKKAIPKNEPQDETNA